MKKLKLSLDELTVDSFQVSSPPDTRGTVIGQGETEMESCYTCDGYTCGGTTVCVDCEQQTATCHFDCSGGFSNVYTCDNATCRNTCGFSCGC